MTLRVTVVDIETGEHDTEIVPDGDYILICAAPCYRAHVTAHANGTHVITVKGRLMRGRIGAPADEPNEVGCD